MEHLSRVATADEIVVGAERARFKFGKLATWLCVAIVCGVFWGIVGYWIAEWISAP